MLTIEGLRISYGVDGQRAVAVRDVSFLIPDGVAVAVVGESGSGKSSVALGMMGLIKPPVGRVEAGQVTLNGTLLQLSDEDEMRSVLREEIGYVPQDPTSSLDPLFTIRQHIDESLDRRIKGRDRSAAIVALLEALGLSNATRRLDAYPHEFSGGMKQRVAIAVALARQPKLLVADEPTTALDVTTQLSMLKLLDEHRRRRHLSMMFITHDLSVARFVCQGIVVLYAGRVVETGPLAHVMGRPRHPYTRALAAAVPALNVSHERLADIPGQAPRPGEIGQGCPFAPRCPIAIDRCLAQEPPLRNLESSASACWRADEL